MGSEHRRDWHPAPDPCKVPSVALAPCTETVRGASEYKNGILSWRTRIGPHQVWHDTPKSGKGRSVIVPPHIRADLLAHLAGHVGKDPTAQLFPAVHGCHLNDRVFRDYLAPALKTIAREDMRIHDLRHFAGTQAARVGNLPETMARLAYLLT
jgi:integrase